MLVIKISTNLSSPFLQHYVEQVMKYSKKGECPHLHNVTIMLGFFLKF